MGNWTGKIVSVLAVLFLLIYAGYQGYRYMYTPYRTETAYEYTVSDALHTNGLIVRDEVLIEGGMDGAPSYCVSEGEKVKKGTEIIRYYDNGLQARNAAHAEQLDLEIQLLTKVQDPGSYMFANSEALSGQIDELIGQIVDENVEGSEEDMYTLHLRNATFSDALGVFGSQLIPWHVYLGFYVGIASGVYPLVEITNMDFLKFNFMAYIAVFSIIILTFTGLDRFVPLFKLPAEPDVRLKKAA